MKHGVFNLNTTTQMDIVVLDAPTQRVLGLTLGSLTWALSLVIVLIASAMCLLRPEQSAIWMAAMAFLPLVNFTLRMLPVVVDDESNARITRAVLAAGLLILVPLTLRLVEALGVLDYSVTSRAIGVTIGVGLLLAGGYFARGWLDLLSVRVGEVVAARVLHFVSWGVMAGGIGYALIWLAAPLDVANLWASAVLGAALLLVTARSFIALRLGNRRFDSRR